MTQTGHFYNVITACDDPNLPGGRLRWRNSHCPWWKEECHAPCHKHGGALPQCYTNWNHWAVGLTVCYCWSGSSQALPLPRSYPHLMSYPFLSPGCYCLQWQSKRHTEAVGRSISILWGWNQLSLTHCFYSNCYREWAIVITVTWVLYQQLSYYQSILKLRV